MTEQKFVMKLIKHGFFIIFISVYMVTKHIITHWSIYFASLKERNEMYILTVSLYKYFDFTKIVNDVMPIEDVLHT